MSPWEHWWPALPLISLRPTAGNTSLWRVTSVHFRNLSVVKLHSWFTSQGNKISPGWSGCASREKLYQNVCDMRNVIWLQFLWYVWKSHTVHDSSSKPSDSRVCDVKDVFLVIVPSYYQTVITITVNNVNSIIISWQNAASKLSKDKGTSTRKCTVVTQEVKQSSWLLPHLICLALNSLTVFFLCVTFVNLCSRVI